MRSVERGESLRESSTRASGEIECFILFCFPMFIQEKAHAAMEYLWMSRHRSSDLVGTVINIHNGDWVRRGEIPIDGFSLCLVQDNNLHVFQRISASCLIL